MSCEKSGDKHTGKKSAINTQPQANVLYNKFCKGCHGKKGNLRFNGAADLTASQLDLVETILIIQEGKGKMDAYQKILTEDEIILLAKYVKSLRKY